MAQKIALETLGCKVNQCESSYIVETLKKHGYELGAFSEKVDIYIIHGCAVTARASYETRQLIRRAHKTNPGAQIVLIGCAAQFEGLELAKQGLVTHVLGNKEKYDIPIFLSIEATTQNPIIAVSNPRNFPTLLPLEHSSMIADRSRAYVKIQDGCNAFCSYCIVPFLRGRSRSLPQEHILHQINHLVKAGFQEVVLTGIHMGKWGEDLNPKKNVLQLLQYLDERGVLPHRLRLSSLEPTECSPELISFLTTKNWFCQHFHIPLQSGDAGVLKLMNRNYSPDYYADIIMEIRKHFPHAAIGADVIAGFPGETEKNFMHTCNLLKKLPISYLHVFPYSPRPGTKCYNFPGLLPKSARKERAHVLRTIGTEKKLQFLKKQLNKTLEIILEVNVGSKMWKGTSRNYVTVLTETPYSSPNLKGQRALVKITKIDPRKLLAIGKFTYFIS